MVGGLPPPPDCAFTVSEKLGSEAESVPSLTEMTMPASVPTSADCGVPDSCPVLALKVAHDGLAVMLKVSVMPLGALAVGIKV